MVNCPICKGKSRSIHKTLRKCVVCGHGFYNPGVNNQAQLNTLYKKEYAKAYRPGSDNEQHTLRQKQYLSDANTLKKHIIKENITILDYGCGTGGFLDALPNHWVKEGLDINKEALNMINKDKVNRLHKHPSELKKDSYDIVSLRGVIEHLIEHDNLMKTLKKCVRPDGLVFISATPDFNSPCAIIYKHKWNQMCYPHHYHHFSSASLTILFARNGFGLISMSHPYLSTPYAKKDDAEKFKDYLLHGAGDTQHAFPGNMMTMVFKKLDDKGNT